MAKAPIYKLRPRDNYGRQLLLQCYFGILHYLKPLIDFSSFVICAAGWLCHRLWVV